MKTKLLIFLIIIFCSCGSESKTDDQFETIDIESNIGNMKVADLSFFCDSIRYIPLQSVDNMLLSAINGIKILKNLIIVYDRSNCLVYDSLFFGHLPNNTGNNRLKALIMNKYGEVRHGYRNYIFFVRDFKRSTSSSDIFAHFNRFRNTFFYKDYFNDTLFMLTNQSELVARYAFDFGRYKFPVSERAKIQNWKFTMSDYIFIWEVFQTDDYLFINCDFKNHFPAKRLTPKTILPGMVSMGNTSNALGIYNKKDKSLFFCKPTDTDNPLYASGLCNDIDAGPRFFPKVQVNDSIMIMWITAKELKDHVESNDFKNNNPKYPEKKKELEELANRLTVFDNPVLMLVTFRK